MNKIYLEPINKSQLFMDGIKKQENLLKSKGITIDANKLSEACRLLKEAGEKQETIEKELKMAREEAHKKLELLKTLYAEYKTPIKQNFAPESWNVFGIPDKK